MAMKYFADAHFHVMTMEQPNFAAFVRSLYGSTGELISANATLDYIITPQMLKGERLLNTVSNTLTAFERPIGETFMMMEDDLLGFFDSERKASYAPSMPYSRGGKLHIRDMEFDRMIMIPLLMDFSQDQKERDSLYYTFPAEDKITPYIKETVRGMKEYYSKRPDGLFEFYPFAGIEPALHSFDFLKDFLDRYINTSHRMHKAHDIPRKPFYGIKIYPPLGFDPWPDDKETLEKHRYLYSFCQRNRVPIITHCDDQGFRGVNAQLAWKYTDPASWRTVLENYPELVIDFAHFGKQYAVASRHSISSIRQRILGLPDSPWFNSIISLMMDFRNVYADLSFSGCAPEFYVNLSKFLESVSKEERETIIGRILFGSDFSVNLLKVESYTEYYSVFEKSPLSDEELARIASENIFTFLGF